MLIENSSLCHFHNELHLAQVNLSIYDSMVLPTSLQRTRCRRTEELIQTEKLVLKYRRSNSTNTGKCWVSLLPLKHK